MKHETRQHQVLRHRNFDLPLQVSVVEASTEELAVRLSAEHGLKGGNIADPGVRSLADVRDYEAGENKRLDRIPTHAWRTSARIASERLNIGQVTREGRDAQH